MRDPAFLLFGLRPDAFSWRGVYLLALVFGGSLLGAGLLAPPLYFGIQALASGADDGLWAYLARHPFPRYVDRLRWLPVLLALPWLIRACGLGSARALGLSRPVPWRLFGGALLGGFAMLGLLAGIQLSADAVDPRPNAFALLTVSLLPQALLSGLLIAVLEETIFRGLVLRQFYSALRPWPAIFATSLFFALLHFKKIPPSVWGPDSVVGWDSGLYVAMWTVGSVIATFDGLFFANYLLVGVVLCLVTLRTGSLWAGIGLHAGWVAFLRAYGTVFAEPGQATLLLGGTRIIDGLVSFAMLAALAVWLARTKPEGTRDPAPAPASMA